MVWHCPSAAACLSHASTLPVGLFCSPDGAFPSAPLSPRGSSALLSIPLPTVLFRIQTSSCFLGVAAWLPGARQPQPCTGHMEALPCLPPLLLLCPCSRGAVTRCKQGFPRERPAALIPFFRQVLNPSHAFLILPSIPSPVRPSPSVTTPTQPFLLHCTSCPIFASFLSCLERLWASAASPILLQEAAPLWALTEGPGQPWAPSSCCLHLP